jgi:hypothetical protein
MSEIQFRTAPTTTPSRKKRTKGAGEDEEARGENGVAGVREGDGNEEKRGGGNCCPLRVVAPRILRSFECH